MDKTVEKIRPVLCGDVKKWEEINTFECAFGRVTPETCEKLRTRPTLKALIDKVRNFVSKEKSEKRNGEENSFQLIRPTVCENCKDWQRLCEEVYKKRKAYLEELRKQKEKEVGVMKGKILDDKVREKAKELYLQGYSIKQIAKTLGIGKSTVSTWKKKENWDKEKANNGKEAKGGDNGNKPLKITIDFTGYEELLNTLKMQAQEEMRSLELQILWELKNRVKEKLAVKEGI